MCSFSFFPFHAKTESLPIFFEQEREKIESTNFAGKKNNNNINNNNVDRKASSQQQRRWTRCVCKWMESANPTNVMHRKLSEHWSRICDHRTQSEREQSETGATVGQFTIGKSVNCKKKKKEKKPSRHNSFIYYYCSISIASVANAAAVVLHFVFVVAHSLLCEPIDREIFLIILFVDFNDRREIACDSTALSTTRRETF